MTTFPVLEPRSQLPLIPTDASFGRVLFGIDFGPASLAAARWATTNVALRAHALLTHVLPDDGEPRRRGAERLDQLAPAIRGGLGGFAATLDVATTRVLVRLGRPSHWLSALANEAEAALMVLGRRADANRLRIGEPNVIERAARRTSADVLVVPEGVDAPVGHVIAAVDESAFAKRAVAAARRLARLHEVPLTILHVLAPTVGAYDRVLRGVRRIVGGRQSELPAKQSPIDTTSPIPPSWLVALGQTYDIVLGRDRAIATVGDAAREITRVAHDVSAPLVVVGIRGSDHAPPGSIGSTARELMMRAPFPVLAANGAL
jgi:nucleotide-binding universal stress UspA family protein